MAKVNWVGRMLFRLAVLGLLGWIAYIQYGVAIVDHTDHIIMDQARTQEHDTIYGECKKPIF